MPPGTSRSSESHLDALIARIHGLTGSVPAPSERPAHSLAPEAEQRAEQRGEDAARPFSPPPPLPGAGPLSGRPSNSPEPAGALEAERAAAASPPNAAGRDRESESWSQPNGASPQRFIPCRDEPWRPLEPDSLESAGVRESSVEQLVMRYLLARGEVEGRRVADQIKLPFRLVEPLLSRLKNEQMVAHRRGSTAGDYVYVLTEGGRKLGRSYTQECTYFGACPVPLSDYIESVKRQTVEGQNPRKTDLERAFSDLLIDARMLERLGPAVNSGRGMFLFGYPGNGKTSIAERVTSAFGKYVWIPRAIDIDGDILRVFDPLNHDETMPDSGDGWLDHGGFDKRWVRIRRPTIVAGGELTMEMLEAQCNPATNISEAPLQMKSNCGTLVIDDFGRQKMSVDQLLNRWIVPLEKRFDFLNMNSGKKIQVPFDQLVVFSTNLEPRDLVDDAFLRRIPYKIEVLDPCEADFRKLFGIMCRVLKIPPNPAAVEHLIERHYKPTKRPFRNCQPRDLLLQVKNYCLYQDLPVELKNEYFDFAADVYFSVM